VGVVPRRVLLDLGPARDSPSFRSFLVAVITSISGRQAVSVALPFQVYLLTHSSLTVGLVSLARLPPMMLAGLYGGVLVDRYDRRRVMFVNRLLNGVCSGALAVTALFPHPSLLPIIVLAAVGAGLGNIEMSCRLSIPPRLFPDHRLASASSLQQAATQIAVVVGPILGGLVIGAIALSAAFLVDVLMALPALLAISRLPPLPPLGRPPAWGLGVPLEGLGFALRSPLLRATFLIDLVAMIFGAPTALFPALALTVYHVGPAGLGLLYSAIGMGGMVASALTGWVGSVQRRGLAVTLAVLVWGSAMTGFGLTAPLFIAGLGLLGLAGGADVVSAIFRTTIVQMATPDRLRGRIGSLNSLVVVSGPGLGDLESGGVAALSSPVFSVVFGGVACVIGALILAGAVPSLRSGRPEPALDAAEPALGASSPTR